MVFCDQGSKLNRRSKPERRDLVITEQAFYLVMRQRINNEICYKVKTRTPLASIRAISLSTLADNYFVVHTGGSEADFLLENEHKTEIVMLLREQTREAVQITFNDNITYKLATGDSRTINFQKNESASRVQLKKAGKQLTVGIASGLPRDTDTTPKNFANRGQNYQFSNAGRAQPKSSAKAAGRSQAGGKTPGQPQGLAVSKGVAKGVAKPADHGRSLPSPTGAKPTGKGSKPAASTGARALPKPAGKSSFPQAKALYNYDAATSDELSFREDDIIGIVTRDSGGWWEGELNGKRGWIPANYVQEL